MPLRAHLNWTQNCALSAFALHTALQRRKAHLQHALSLVFFMASKCLCLLPVERNKKKRVASGERGKKHSCCLFPDEITKNARASNEKLPARPPVTASGKILFGRKECADFAACVLRASSEQALACPILIS